jgi:signal transduction histidine kinase
VQMRIKTLMESNIGILELSVLEPEGDDFTIAASSNDNLLGHPVASAYYHQAWTQLGKNEGLAVDSARLAAAPGGAELAAMNADKERFWLVTLPLYDQAGDKTALLSMKVSSKIVDDLTDANGKFSLYLLLITVGVVILFLLVAVRLWDYAVLYRKIKEVDRMKDDFVSMTSHELRTPVTGIRGYLSMMLEGEFGPLSDKFKKVLGLVQSASERLAILVDDLLNVNQIEQGRLKMYPRPTDINDIIGSVIDELGIQAEKKGLRLDYKPHAGDLPLIEVDTNRFKQVLVNLAGNAVKYTEKGGVEIVTREKFDGRVLEIAVKDTGIGMSAQALKRIFEKFYRAQSDKMKKIPGTGLGLWITKRLVELMDGTIEIDSIEGVGTQAVLRFPVVKQSKDE